MEVDDNHLPHKQVSSTGALPTCCCGRCIEIGWTRAQGASRASHRHLERGEHRAPGKARKIIKRPVPIVVNDELQPGDALRVWVRESV